jgi:hypothetical protein
MRLLTEVPDYADFRDRIFDEIVSENKGVIIPTMHPNLVMRVIFTTDYDERYYISLENTAVSEDVFEESIFEYGSEPYKKRILGCVELVIKLYREQSNCLEPHSFMDYSHHGKGLIEGIYRMLLDGGITLVSGYQQTIYSNGLWLKLSKDYQFDNFDSWKDKILSEDDDYNPEDNHIRLMLKKKEAYIPPSSTVRDKLIEIVKKS